MKRADSITAAANGITVTTGAASAFTAIPNAANGSRPYYVRLTSTVESFILPGLNGVVATGNSLMVQPADSVLLAVGGNTHIAFIQGPTAGRVNIYPTEDQ